VPTARIRDRFAALAGGVGLPVETHCHMAGFRHVMDGLGTEVPGDDADLVFKLVQLCASATGKPLADDELRLIAGYPRELSLLFPGQF
jgi:hypothetical protein